MKLCASNIGWAAEDDSRIYKELADRGFLGIEIAPTRVFPHPAYQKLREAEAFAKRLFETYGFAIPSMQSIWFGRQESIFGTPEERDTLAAYTKEAVDFASAVGCKNLVFGCPRNRSVPKGRDPREAIGFFNEIGLYAAKHGCTIALEANPPIYNTNYLNTTAEAFEAAASCSEGVSVNLDIGTMVQNSEGISVLEGRLPMVSHIHISEPYLAPIERRQLHRDLAAMLRDEGYDRFVSIEMKAQPADEVLRIADYITEVFS